MPAGPQREAPGSFRRWRVGEWARVVTVVSMERNGWIRVSGFRISYLSLKMALCEI